MATTYSQMIDDMAVELVRKDMRAMMAKWLNQTIRECHFRPNTQASILYDENRVEDEFVVTAANPALWTIPSITSFQAMESIWSSYAGIYLPEKNPKIALDRVEQPFAEFYYYRTGSQYAISGVAQGDTLKMSWHQYPKPLEYLQQADRLIQFDYNLGGYVRIADGSIPSQPEIDRESNWLFQRWDMVLEEGLRAKAYKRLGDDSRMRSAYSAYQSALTALWQTEPSSN